MMEKIQIGKIVKAMGIKGEVKIYSYSDDPGRFEKLKKILVEDLEHTIEGTKAKGGTPVVKLAGINDRSQAEKLVNSNVYMYHEDLEELPKDQYYIKDLIGAKVIDESLGEIGIVKEVLADRAQHLYKIISNDGKEKFFPWVREFIKEVDIEKKEIHVRLPQGIFDV